MEARAWPHSPGALKDSEGVGWGEGRLGLGVETRFGRLQPHASGTRAAVRPAAATS